MSMFKMKGGWEENGALFYKHFTENNHSVWDQSSPGAKNRINMSKEGKLGFSGNYIPGYI